MIDQSDEVFLLFLEESQEHLEDIETDLLELESQQNNLDDDLLNKVFRAVHTVKGGSSFFGLTQIQSLAHSMENILSLIRTHDIQISNEIVSVLLNGADKLYTMVNTPESMNTIEVESVITALDQFVSGCDSRPADSSSSMDFRAQSNEINIAFENGPTIFTITEQEVISAQTADGGGHYIYLIKYDLYSDIEEKGRTPQQVVKEFLQLTFFIDSFTDYSQLGTLDNLHERMELPFYVLCSTLMDPLIMCEFIGLNPENIVVVFDYLLTPQKEKVPEKTEEILTRNTIPEKSTDLLEASESNNKVPTQDKESEFGTNIALNSSTQIKRESRTSVRIPVAQLETLMSLAGELVLSRNELMQKVQKLSSPEINDVAQKIDIITSELHEAIRVTRMQSIGVVFNKFKRTVHDMSLALGKKIDFIVEGEDVELDRSIIEAIGDPLTHMVRNSIDHGIEMPDTRVSKGKPAIGSIKLSALRQSEQVLITIEDDGRGIDPKAIGSIAVKKGIITEYQLSKLSNIEIVKLIFAPGFSTVEKITDISGRGVGMDVVMNSFTNIGGIVDIDSTVDIGTIITIKLPLTLAIIPIPLSKEVREHLPLPQGKQDELVPIKT